MGGKKKAAAKKEDEGEPDSAKMNLILQSQLDSMQAKIVIEQERQDKSRKNE